MAISTIHRLDKVTGPVALSEITQSKISAGISSMIETPAGHIHPMFRANKDQKPVIEFSTPQLSTLLGTVTLAGTAISGTPLVSWVKKATTTGSVARATTSHSKVTVNLGILHLASLSLPHNGRAEARCIVTAGYDGTNDPLVITNGSVALSGNLTATEYFCAGPVSLNGSVLPGVKSIDVDTGTDLLNESADGEVWPSFVGIQHVAPTVTVKLFEKVMLSTLGLQGLALDGTDGLEFYARKYSNTSRVANATAQHIYFQGLNGTVIPIDTDGQDSSPYTDTIKFELISASDSVSPLTISTGSTIT